MKNKHTFHKAKFSMKTTSFYTLQESYFSIKKQINKQTKSLKQNPQHNGFLPYNIVHFVLGSFDIPLYLAIQLLQMPSLLFCITGSLLNLPSFLQNSSAWYLLQRNEGPKTPCICKLLNWMFICFETISWALPLPSPQSV